MTSYESTTSRFQPQSSQCVLIEDLLPLYVEGEVSPGTRDVIVEHLAQCEHCAGFLAGAQSVRAQLRQEQQVRSRVVADDRPAFNVMQALQFIAVTGGVLAIGMMGIFLLGIANNYGLYGAFSMLVMLVAGSAAVYAAWMLLMQWRNAQPLARRHHVGTLAALGGVGVLMLFAAVLLLQYGPFYLIPRLVDMYGPLLMRVAFVGVLLALAVGAYKLFGKGGRAAEE